MTPQQLQEALGHQKRTAASSGKAFVTLGYVRDEEITSLLSRQYGVPSINLDHFEVDPAIIKIIPAETARKYQILPLIALGRHAHDRHGGSHQRLRHGRHQVHDRLQRRARGGLRDVAGGCDREVLRLHALTSAQAGRRGRRQAAAAMGSHGRQSGSPSRRSSTARPDLRRHGLGGPLRGGPRLHRRGRSRRRDGRRPRTTRSTSAPSPSRRRPRRSSSSRTSSSSTP